jgi:hypothetical protein
VNNEIKLKAEFRKKKFIAPIMDPNTIAPKNPSNKNLLRSGL